MNGRRYHDIFRDLCDLAEIGGVHVALLASQVVLLTSAGDEYRHIDVLAVLPPNSTEPIVGCRLGDGLDGENLNTAARHLIGPLHQHIVKQHRETR